MNRTGSSSPAISPAGSPGGSDGVGRHWLPNWLPWLPPPGGRGASMALTISEDRMLLTVDGAEVATAIRVGDWWSVSTWPPPLTYNQAITALTLAERLSCGYGGGDPFVINWREELANG